MSQSPVKLVMSLDDFRPLLESAATEAGVTLDFLMHQWNGRFATYNVGRPVVQVEDRRRGVRDEPRRYRLIGRLKATSQPGYLQILLSPPSACDLAPTSEEEALWERFVGALADRIEGKDAPTG